jgi:hypothetical protein
MEVVNIVPGDIYHIFCDQTNPPKNKFHLFLSDGYYLLINTKNFPTGLLITKQDYSFLTHDSFIGSRLFRYSIDKNIDEKDKRGGINNDTINQLKGFISNEKSLSQNSKSIIMQSLNEILKSRK